MKTSKKKWIVFGYHPKNPFGEEFNKQYYNKDLADRAYEKACIKYANWQVTMLCISVGPDNDINIDHRHKSPR